MIVGIDPKVDYAFKRVFGDQRNGDILTHLLNAVLRLAEPIESVEILNPFNERDFAEGKLSILDIKARDQVGRLLNVEMQLWLPPHFSDRVLYYLGGTYWKQLAEGDPYRRLRPAISICFLDQVLFPGVADYHLTFGLIDREHGLCFSDQLQIHLLELPKFHATEAELDDDLRRWLYILRHGETMDLNALPAALAEPVYQWALEAFAMLTQDELERERYEARVKAQRDYLSGLEGAREQGLEQGELIGRIHAYEQLLHRPLTPSEQLVALSLEQLGVRAEQLQAELLEA